MTRLKRKEENDVHIPKPNPLVALRSRRGTTGKKYLPDLEILNP